MSPEIILSLMLRLPAWHEDVRESRRKERLDTIASAIVSVSERAARENLYRGTDELERVLVMLGWYESRFARHVHADQCRDYECDPVVFTSRTGVKSHWHRAKSVWQVQLHPPSVPLSLWQQSGGTSQQATDMAAWLAARAFAAARARCGSLSGGISMYATGKWCSWRGTVERLDLVQRLERMASNG